MRSENYFSRHFVTGDRDKEEKPLQRYDNDISKAVFRAGKNMYRVENIFSR